MCPGVPLSITCSHDNTASGVSRWKVTGTISQNCNRVVGDGIPQDDTCNAFVITMVNSDTGSELSSTAQLAAACL